MMKSLLEGVLCFCVSGGVIVVVRIDLRGDGAVRRRDVGAGGRLSLLTWRSLVAGRVGSGNEGAVVGNVR